MILKTNDNEQIHDLTSTGFDRLEKDFVIIKDFLFLKFFFLFFNIAIIKWS